MDFLLKVWIAVWAYLLVVVPLDLGMYKGMDMSPDFGDIGMLAFIDADALILLALFVGLI